MTTTSSPEAVADPAGSSAAAPYGTRSRGRNAPRPNYAEDRDIDMDFEATPAKGAKRNSGVALTNIVNGSKSDSEKSSPAQPRKSLNNGPAPPVIPKEAIPGTSSFSARPEDVNGAGPLRKRKATASTPSSANAAKKIFTAAPGDSDGGYFTNMVSFEASEPILKDGQITADDGTTFEVNDHVYLICEPPGEPYYLARIMEFIPSKTKDSGVIESLRVNWYYRPRDIQRHNSDSRYLFASMHSDTCPLSSLRGKCSIRHVSEIQNLNDYKKNRNSFWYDKMFDRYIHRLYDVIPTKDVVNVPGNVKRVLNDRWRFILVEVGKGKELTGAVKTCKRCHLFAANSESVDCAVCHSTYHMHCVRPALTKKPARGFAWACAPCSRAQERKLEARNTPLMGENRADGDDEVMEEEEDEHQPNGAANGTSVSTPAAVEEEPQPETAEQMAQTRMWPYRYLGIHCRVEDALDYDDRIYPRASSRLGPKHQAIVNPWPGRPVEYVKPIDLKKRVKATGAKATGPLSKDAKAALEAAKQEKANRPKWIQDEPAGYIARGEDEPVTINGKQARTAELKFKMPTAAQMPARGEDDVPGSHLSDADREAFIDDYMRQAKELAPHIGVEMYNTNFLDKALQLLYSESFDVQAALAKLKKANQYKDLKEPHLRPEELKLFEQGVAKYGSEWLSIYRHVKTVPHWAIVRFYYMWKKTPRGKQVWGSYEGRRGKKEVRRQSVASSKLLDDVADDHDDSAFDSEKAIVQKRGFQCKFCETRSSRQWRRAPLVPPGTAVPSDPSAKKDKGPMLTVALCLRCALLWRKYALHYEDVDELGKRIAASGNKSWRRRIDEELFAQLLLGAETPLIINNSTATTAAAMGIQIENNPQLLLESKMDAAKKKARTDIPSTATTSASTSVEPMPKKKMVTEKGATDAAPVIPDPPKAKTLPCAVCNSLEPIGDEHLSCRDCRLTVHRNCYGVQNSRPGNKWLCDMCSNDRSPSISTTYECVLCPVTSTEHELMETTKSNSRKKSDRDKEKERLEKEMITEAIKLYRQRQEAVGKPVSPREPLKRTAGNNWAHVMCSLWTPEIKYGDAKELEPAEGFGTIPKDRWRQVCKICKSSKGACIPCHSTGCNVQVHVGCAFQAQYRFGLDLAPVKISRRDSVQTIRLGEEVGMATPVIYCPNHSVPAAVHDIGELAGPDGLNALQLFAQAYKQADLTLTGTSRKAAYVQQSVTAPHHHGASAGNRRVSTSSGLAAARDPHKAQSTPFEDTTDTMDIDTEEHPARPARRSISASGHSTGQRCFRCSTDFSPRWWPCGRRSDSRAPLTNGAGMGSMHLSQSPFAQLNNDAGEQLYECHKCHLKNPHPPTDPAPAPAAVPDPRPSPYAGQRPMLATLRGPNFVPHTVHPAPPAPQPQPPTGVLGRPMPPSHSHSAPIPYGGGFEQRAGSDSALRNGMSPPAYHAGPPPPPPHHMGTYPPPHPPVPPSSHYSNTGPPPPPPTQPYGAHQSPYGPIPARSPLLSQPPPRSYAASASPPIVSATVNRSPQTSLSALNGGPPPRMYSVDRMGAPSHSPPVAPAHMNPRGPTPPTRPEDTPPSVMASSNRVNGTSASAGSGASASPSLKNLLS
ncbi:hypothetical protein N7532_010846 [Penicillium argentinense]|uniref:Uncharacterized protein n=1 Tax=Penicillium argentinense TaxID=1131581 RepID=A0A9W9EQM1_9EURO|nr:uncharacterized protein N7532_010846 [Penicillium argentinense]KAJ5086075.1 hypothetical protein N7532_010846 [Penicillium argentinense]